jgi:hypothetical protein
MHNNRTPTFKVKVTLDFGQHCLFNGVYRVRSIAFNIHEGILKVLGTNIHNNETMCQPQKPVSNLQGDGNSWRPNIYILFIGYILCPVHNFFIDKGILK